MTDDEERSGPGFREGVRRGLGLLGAFKDAVEQTIEEARDRGDVSPERAREIVKTTVDRAQSAAEEARERFDFVARRDHEELQERVRAMERRLSELEERVSEPRERRASPADDGGEPSGRAGV